MPTTDGKPTTAEFQSQARLLLKPLDLDGLIAKGVLSKKGAWYRILKFKAVPEHAWAQVSEMASDPPLGSKVKFWKLSKKAIADLKKIVGGR